jgi:hypothetical protein
MERVAHEERKIEIQNWHLDPQRSIISSAFGSRADVPIETAAGRFDGSKTRS